MKKSRNFHGMKVVIIEDEVPAAEKLERYIKRYDSKTQILTTLTSIADASAWLTSNSQPLDLIFMDIQLTDGKSFELFDKVEINSPIIFITAFDEYALDAFRVNSIDYLLKPIVYDDLEQALDKFNKLKAQFEQPNDTMGEIRQALKTLHQSSYKNRFMVKLGEHIKSITTDQIELFYAEGRDVYLVNSDNRKFIIDYKLEQLETLLDPVNFFRVNRSFIININGFSDVLVYSNSRLRVVPNVELDKEIIVSREKVAPFKDWCDGNG